MAKGVTYNIIFQRGFKYFFWSFKILMLNWTAQYDVVPAQYTPFL
jgi:hypothetical protein